MGGCFLIGRMEKIFEFFFFFNGARNLNSLISLATGFRLDTPGFESRHGQKILSFPKPSIRSVGPVQPHNRRVPSCSVGAKSARVWSWPLVLQLLLILRISGAIYLCLLCLRDVHTDSPRLYCQCAWFIFTALQISSDACFFFERHIPKVYVLGHLQT